ncbi:MAG: bifunctional precorrin-2 dehydrogenase/sirohydrochlorin ferrochelatase [Sulfurovum sp.]|nr:bifunctional precorrin-2 dehydrogenase/sirohydrochlorin ferrochelatase [Sulfurovum sp.]
MAYFPAFIQMEDAKVLLVGGGNIAREKLEKLLDFTSDISLISLEFTPEIHALMQTHQLSFQEKAYVTGDINSFDIVVVATNTQDLHKEIYEESRTSRILVNSVDNTEYCDFIFPSYVKKEDLTIAFSTGGASPAFAKKIRRHFEDLIPDEVGPFLAKMKELRKTLPKGKERMAHFEGLVADFFKKYFPKS